jgi:hypothetical protein
MSHERRLEHHRERHAAASRDRQRVPRTWIGQVSLAE